MEKYKAANKKALDALLLAIPGVEAAKMFGSPSYTVKGKVFAVLSGEGVGVKVTRPVADAMVAAGSARYFEPREGAVWREWVYIEHANPDDYRADKSVFLAAIEQMGSQG